ncbi:alpha-(1,3)-fucosyltransferase fut-1-like [Saccostrea echinata]|uniref:alpha-(1,3)-fucosyltransferase fut-1-like n=1 Tax=Saccostrea echinata TaxID=191078 RepID=UPI002A833EB4|nr:alpha-(1,3)-fucosyltransferase fut-1-like [Saccostrea echinata]
MFIPPAIQQQQLHVHMTNTVISESSKKTFFTQQNRNNTISKHKEYTILWYNIPSYLVDKLNYAKSSSCESQQRCILSRNTKDLHKSDVVIFTHFNMGGNPPYKKKNQIWVFNTMENTAFMSKPSPRWNNKLDWLMSYRRRSDIPRPYGILKKRLTPLVKNYTDVFQKKKQFGVWMSGHCPVPSRRRDYIKELKKYIQIDMFGSCGDRVCGHRTPVLGECLRNFSRDYKFYFAFENNICEDYSTEKIYNLYLGNLNVIPVINGPKSASEYLPKGSFISILDFPSPEALAEKLKVIGSNESVFTQYLKEKDKYYALGTHSVFLSSMCKICHILDRTNGKPERPKATIWERFSPESEC